MNVIHTLFSRAGALLARFAFWCLPAEEAELENMTSAEKVALLKALNPDYRVYFWDEVRELRHFDLNELDFSGGEVGRAQSFGIPNRS